MLTPFTMAEVILTCCRLKDEDVTWLYGPLMPGSYEPPTKPEKNTRFPHQARLKRATLGLESLHASSETTSQGTASPWPPMPLNGRDCWVGEGRHVHFNEEVEQYIAIDGHDGDDDYNGSDESDSDDGGLMMKKPSKGKSVFAGFGGVVSGRLE
jgi:hypothetical protein